MLHSSQQIPFQRIPKAGGGRFITQISSSAIRSGSSVAGPSIQAHWLPARSTPHLLHCFQIQALWFISRDETVGMEDLAGSYCEIVLGDLLGAREVVALFVVLIGEMDLEY